MPEITDQDIARADAAEGELNRFIARRAAERERREANGSANGAARAGDGRAAGLRASARAEWSRYHEHLAEIHTALAVEHQTKAARLAEEGSS